MCALILIGIHQPFSPSSHKSHKHWFQSAQWRMRYPDSSPYGSSSRNPRSYIFQCLSIDFCSSVKTLVLNRVLNQYSSLKVHAVPSKSIWNPLSPNLWKKKNFLKPANWKKYPNISLVCTTELTCWVIIRLTNVLQRRQVTPVLKADQILPCLLNQPVAVK